MKKIATVLVAALVIVGCGGSDKKGNGGSGGSTVGAGGSGGSTAGSGGSGGSGAQKPGMPTTKPTQKAASKQKPDTNESSDLCTADVVGYGLCYDSQTDTAPADQGDFVFWCCEVGILCWVNCNALGSICDATEGEVDCYSTGGAPDAGGGGCACDDPNTDQCDPTCSCDPDCAGTDAGGSGEVDAGSTGCVSEIDFSQATYTYVSGDDDTYCQAIADDMNSNGLSNTGCETPVLEVDTSDCTGTASVDCGDGDSLSMDCSGLGDSETPTCTLDIVASGTSCEISADW